MSDEEREGRTWIELRAGIWHPLKGKNKLGLRTPRLRNVWSRSQNGMDNSRPKIARHSAVASFPGCCARSHTIDSRLAFKGFKNCMTGEIPLIMTIWLCEPRHWLPHSSKGIGFSQSHIRRLTDPRLCSINLTMNHRLNLGVCFELWIHIRFAIISANPFKCAFPLK
jgi:hypothetical protein